MNESTETAKNTLLAVAFATIGSLLSTPPATAEQVHLSIENLAPRGGLFLTPVWIGAHDGNFDLFSVGASASAGVESLAEDGATGGVMGEFTTRAPGGVQTTVVSPGGFPGAPVFDPGERVTVTLNLNPLTNRYLSYASMVIPSNDAFIGNDDPRAIQLFDAAGNSTGPLSVIVMGSDVLDAGTEDNTEMEAAFINQTGPNMGPTTVGGVVSPHQGFIDSFANPNPGDMPTILGGTTAAGTFLDPTLADFTQPGTPVARITVIPTPSAFAAAGAGPAVLLMCRLMGKRRQPCNA